MKNKIIYDNNCNFCKNVKYILSSLDILNYFVWIPNQEYDIDNLNLEFDKKKFQTSIVVITSSKKVYLEYSACRYIMLHIPFFWPIMPLLFFPIIAPFLGDIIYKKISKNRRTNGLSNGCN